MQPRLFIFATMGWLNIHIKPILYVAFCTYLFVPNKLRTQDVYPIKFDEELKEKFSQIAFPETCSDSFNLYRQIDTLNHSFHKAGYLAASMLAFEKTDKEFKINYQPGEPFTWLSLGTGNVAPELLESLGFLPDFWKEQPVYYGQLALLMGKLIDHFSNHGHPFASIKLDSIQIEDNEVTGQLKLTKNKVFYFDSINIISTVAINPKFLERHLGFRKGALYDQSRVDAIPKRIRELNFIRLDENPTVRFQGNRAMVNLRLVPYQNSRFDILIGILPNENAENRFKITGDVAADLYNKLGQGEYAGFRYKSITSETQELSLEMNYPYLLNLPFGINGSFKLYSNASLNRDVDLQLGVQYQLGSDSKLNIYWHNNSSRLLAIDSSKILAQQRLPANLDIRLNGIGMQFDYQKLNYRYNPRSGFQFKINGTAGLKEILPNQEIKSLQNEFIDFSTSYDTLENGYQFSLHGLLAYYLPLGKVFTIKAANTSGIKFSRQALYRNEAFRIGGTDVLRGSDEESLYTNRYSVFTLEGRLLISTNSYFFVFGDYGLVQLRLDDSMLFDQPYGIGTGLSLDTGAGILLISAAVGSQMGLGLDFGSSKIHIGYINLF